MLADLKYIFFWWLVILFLGAVSLPLIFQIFKNFWDKGYIFSKITSLTIITYVAYLLGIFHFLPFTNPTFFAIIGLIILLNIYWLRQKNNLAEFLTTFKQKLPWIIFEECLFLLILIVWSFIRGYAPDIEGLEKFMDWGFVNSALRSQYMPPSDMWFAGQPINYYYFGHLLFAVLTKISNISSAITYNLAIATVCSLTFVSGFSLASNLAFNYLSAKTTGLKLTIFAGLISGLLLTFGGNLQPVYKIGKNLIQNEGGLVINSETIARASQGYWYPDATRFIGFDPPTNDKTIHEFPLYSFVVADLHGHMNDIPIVIFCLAFLFAMSLWGFKSGLDLKIVIPLGFILSLCYMSNAWDIAVYGLAFAIFSFIYQTYYGQLKSALIWCLTNGLATIICWYLFTLPFSLNFTPMLEGIKLSDARSPFYQLFILYGGFWLIDLPLLAYFLVSLFKSRKKTKLVITLPDIFAVSLIITATILIIIPEIIYIKDIYIYEHRRANTMFKLVYQAFMMYSLVSGYALVKLSQSFTKNKLGLVYKLIFVLVFFVHLVYPKFAIKGYYGLTEYKGLWGLNFLKNQYPDNLEAINWINKNITGQPVMLEAAGDSYTTYNQISAATGLPTVEGWLVHEWLWRGGYDQPGARSNDVQKIYESIDFTEVSSLLQKYSVDYVFVGSKEFEKYPMLYEKNFEKMGTVVFQSGKTKIYKLVK